MVKVFREALHRSKDRKKTDFQRRLYKKLLERDQGPSELQKIMNFLPREGIFFLLDFLAGQLAHCLLCPGPSLTVMENDMV